MMKRRWSSIVLLVLGAGMWPSTGSGQTAAKADSDQRERQARVDVVRSDIRAQKTALINQTMQFNDAEMKAFWPVYRDFESKQAALNDERLKLIASYADASATISDKEADAMIARVFEFESRRTSLKREYYKKLKAALPIKTAAKALALEQQIGLLVDSNIAAELLLRPIK